MQKEYKHLSIFLVLSDIIFVGMIMMILLIRSMDVLVLGMSNNFTEFEKIFILVLLILFIIDLVISYLFKENLIEPGKRLAINLIFITFLVFFVASSYLIYYLSFP